MNILPYKTIVSNNEEDRKAVTIHCYNVPNNQTRLQEIQELENYLSNLVNNQNAGLPEGHYVTDGTIFPSAFDSRKGKWVQVTESLTEEQARGKASMMDSCIWMEVHTPEKDIETWIVKKLHSDGRITIVPIKHSRTAYVVQTERMIQNQQYAVYSESMSHYYTVPFVNSILPELKLHNSTTESIQGMKQDGYATIGDIEGGSFYLCYSADCAFPPLYLVWARSEENAIDCFQHDCESVIAVDCQNQSEINEMIECGEWQHNDNGTLIDVSSTRIEPIVRYSILTEEDRK